MKKNLTKPHIKIKDGKGNYVIFHCAIEEDAKPPEKIKMKSITFDFGEGGGFKYYSKNNSFQKNFINFKE